MDKPMPGLMFRVMSLIHWTKDVFIPPEDLLIEAGVKNGLKVLDYGCGPGSFSIAAAKAVGESGKVYALDIHPLAVKRVREVASKLGLTNIETIFTDCATGLSDGSIDIVLLYDIYHMLSNPQIILEELHRVLKPEGILSFHNPHMKGDKIISGMTGNGLFRLSHKGKRSFSFRKEEVVK